MATQTEIIDIQVNSEQAIKQLETVNDTILEQRDILVLLEEELLRVQAIENKTSKTNLAARRVAKQNVDDAKAALKDQRLGLKKLNIERLNAQKLVKESNALQANQTDIIQGIDKLTGGYATRIVQLKDGFFAATKSAKTFIDGLSGIKKALIATGVGALVVALGLVVAYWEDIVALFDDGSKKLQEQADLHKENLKLSEQQLVSLTNQEKILELQGKSTANIVAEKRKLLLILQEENALLLNNLKVQLESEKAQIKEITFYDKLKIVAAQALGGIGRAGIERAKALSGTEEELLRLKEIEEEIQKTKTNGEKLEIRLLQLDKQKSDSRTKEISDNEKLQEQADEKLQNLKDRIREAEANKQDEARALELQKIREHYLTLLQEAKDAGLKTQELEDSLDQKLIAKQAEFDAIDAKRKKKKEAEDAAFRLKQQDEAISELELQKNFDKLSFQEQKKILNEREQLLLLDKLFFKTLSNDQILELESQFSEAKIEIGKKEIELEEEKIKNKKAVVNAIAQFADAESGIGKALLIVKQGLALKETIMDLKRITFKGIEAVGSAGVATAQNVAESSKIGFPQNIITIAGAIAQGVGIIKSVKNAVSKTKAAASASASASVPSITSPSPPAAVSQAPSFNIVGASETSQLANVINTQENLPVQAYVVSQDITTAQSLQNNIIQSATID